MDFYSVRFLFSLVYYFDYKPRLDQQQQQQNQQHRRRWRQKNVWYVAYTETSKNAAHSHLENSFKLDFPSFCFFFLLNFVVSFPHFIPFGSESFCVPSIFHVFHFCCNSQPLIPYTTFKSCENEIRCYSLCIQQYWKRRKKWTCHIDG